MLRKENSYDVKNSMNDHVFEIMKNVKLGHYHTLKSLMSGNEENDDTLLFMSFDTDSLAIYVYRCFLLLDKETAFLHEKASQIMNVALLHCYIILDIVAV